jgi:hypothetical protein
VISRVVGRGSSLSAVLLSCVVCAVCAGCVAHPVGPARTFDAYEAKARTTADSARSAVATVRLLAVAAADGDLFGTYASISISEQEDALLGTQGTFASIQPPDSRSDALRDELEDILDRAADDVTQVRIEVRRGNLDDLDAFVPALEQDEQALTEFLEAHGAKD